MTFEIDLSGRRAVVTGGGQGVGRGIAKALGAAGAEVFVNDLVEERAAGVVAEIEAAGGTGGTAVFDVTDFAAVQAKFAELGLVDILVNNAGRVGQLHACQPLRRDVRDARGAARDVRGELGPRGHDRVRRGARR